MADNKLPSMPKPKSRPSVTTSISFDWRHSLVVLRSHLPIAMAIAVVACTLTAWQQVRQPKLYEAHAVLHVDRGDRMRNLPGMEGAYYSTIDVLIATQIEQLRNEDLLKQVVASFTPVERQWIANDPAATPSDRLLQKIVRKSVSFQRTIGTALIVVAVVHERPDAAALIANRYAEQAIRYSADRARTSSDASLTFLREQAEDLRKKSEASEHALQEYRQKYNLVSLEANQNIIVDNLKSLNASATAARVARVAIEARLAQAETVIKRGEDAAQIAAITGSDTLSDIARRLADMKGKRAVMAERYGKRHPLMQENERAIEALGKLEQQEVHTAVASLEDQRDKAMAEEQQLNLQRSKAEKEALDLDQRAVEYNILRSAMQTYKTSYSQLLTRLNDATISAQLADSSMKISELANRPSVPISPDVRKIVLVTLGLALAILLGYPFAAEMFFGRIRGSADVEYHLGAELLGEIGSVRQVKEKDRARLVTSEEDEAAAEQFRALYSQLALTSKIDPPKAVLVTSTMPGEGKSFIAANLAECFVAHSRRTLLFDADLRRPTQHRNFGIDNKSGVIRWLEDSGSCEGDLLKNEKLGIVEVVPGLFLLRAGGVSRKATELMDAPQLPALLHALQRQFDVMIFDTPPAGVFPDALAFAKVCHEIVYICRFNAVSRRAVHDVLARLRQTELEFPGIVLNAMPAGFGGSYYYRGYSYQRAKQYAKDYASRPNQPS